MWWLGCIINICGSISINLGTNVMKLGHNMREQSALQEADRKSVTLIKEWQIGVTIFVIGNIANFLSFGFAAQSLLASLGTIQFVSNVYFARFVLREEVTPRVLLATACIVGGCIVLVAFGNHQSANLHVEDMIQLYSRTGYVVYLISLGSLVVVVYCLYKCGKRGMSLKWMTSASVSKLCPPKRRRDSNQMNQIHANQPQRKNPRSRMQPILYAIFSAALGSQSVLMAKTLSSLLRTTMDGDPAAFSSWFTYLILLCFVVSASFWATRLNKSLQLFPAIVIVPLMQINWTLFSILSGGMYFQEFDNFTSEQAALFVFGVLIVISGVVLLSWSPSESAAKSYVTMDSQDYVPSGPLSQIMEIELSANGDGSVSSLDDQMTSRADLTSIPTKGSSHPSLADPAKLHHPKPHQSNPGRPVVSNPFAPQRISAEIFNPMFENGVASTQPAPEHIEHIGNLISPDVDPDGYDPNLDRQVGDNEVDVQINIDDELDSPSRQPNYCHDIPNNIVSFVDDLSIDFSLSMTQGWGLGFPAGGHAPIASVFGLPSTPAASSCGGDDPHHSPTSSLLGSTSRIGREVVSQLSDIGKGDPASRHLGNVFDHASVGETWKGADGDLKAMHQQIQNEKNSSASNTNAINNNRTTSMPPPPARHQTSSFTLPHTSEDSYLSHSTTTASESLEKGCPDKKNFLRSEVLFSTFPPLTFPSLPPRPAPPSSAHPPTLAPPDALLQTEMVTHSGPVPPPLDATTSSHNMKDSEPPPSSMPRSGSVDSESSPVREQTKSHTRVRSEGGLSWNEGNDAVADPMPSATSKLQTFLRSPIEKGTAAVAAAVGKAEIMLSGDSNFDNSSVRRLLGNQYENLEDSEHNVPAVNSDTDIPTSASEDDFSLPEKFEEEKKFNLGEKSDS